MPKKRFSKGDMVSVPNTDSYLVGRVMEVKDLGVLEILWPNTRHTMLVKQDFVRPATKSDVDNAVLGLFWKQVELEKQIEVLERLRDDLPNRSF